MNSSRLRQTADLVARLGHYYVRVVEALVLFCQRRAALVIATALILAGVSGYYAVGHFAITTDTSQILSRDLPFQRLQRQLDQAFPQLNDTAVVVIQGDTADLAADGARRLAAWLRARPEYIDSVYEPGGGEFFRKNGLLYLDSSALWLLSDRLSQAQPLIAQVAADPSLPKLLGVLREGLRYQSGSGPHLSGLEAIFDQLDRTLTSQAAGRFYAVPWDEIITGAHLSEEESTRFLIIKPRPQFKELQPAQAALTAIHEGIADLHLDPMHGVKANVTGSVALDNDQLGALSRDSGLAIVLSLGLVLALLVVGLRSPWQVVFVLITLFIGFSWTAAFALYATGPLNLVSIAFAVLFIGLGVDFGIQFCMRYGEEFQERRSQTEALRRTARGIGGSLGLAAAAAAISFYSFVPTSYAGIADLGIISGTSMLFALFMNVTVLPALLSLRPTPMRRRRSLLPIPRLPFHRHPWVVVTLFTMVSLGGISLIVRSHFDFNPLHLEDPNSEAVKTFENLLQHSRTSPYQIDILEPDLAHADQVARRLARLDVVGQTITLSSFVPDHQDEKLDILQELTLLMPPFTIAPAQRAGANPARIATALEDFRTALDGFAGGHPTDQLAGAVQRLSTDIAAYLSRFKNDPEKFTALQRRIMDGLVNQLSSLSLALQAEPITLENLPRDLRERYLSAKGEARIEVLAAHDVTDNTNMRRFVDAVRNVVPTAVGVPVLLVEGGDSVVNAFIEASVISVILITLLLIVAVRNPIDVLMVLIPLGVAAMLTVEAMSALGISFSLANIIVLPLIIGLGVAFGIYLVMRWRSGVSVRHLLRTSTPEAVWFSALTTTSSFGSLALASYPGMSMLGQTLILGLVSILLAILILLPALLMLRRPDHPAAQPPS